MLRLEVQMPRGWSIYFFCQATLGAAWWVLLLAVPDSRQYFRPAAGPDSMLLSFWLADLVCFVAGSAAAGWFLLRDDPRSRPALWFTAGAVVYAALYCIALSWMTGEAWVAAASMLVPAILTVYAAVDRG